MYKNDVTLKSMRSIISMRIDNPCFKMAATSRRPLEMMVSYVCQHCSAPLNLDGSFDDVDDMVALTSELLTSPLNTSSTTDDDDDDTVIGGSSATAGDLDAMVGESPEHLTSSSVVGGRRYNFTPPICRLTDSGNGFMLVGESSAATTTGAGGRGGAGQDGTDCDTGSSLSHMLAVSSRLFDILSDQSDVDHPLCEECTDSLLDELDQMLKVTEDEYRDYQEFLEKFDDERAASENVDDCEINVESQRAELENLAADERRLLDQLKSVENEKLEAERELKTQSMEMERLRADEEHFLREYFGYKRQLLVHGDEQLSVDNQLRFAQMQLDRLKKTNVFNASFHIWHSGHFGTINNFRLGRLPSVPIEWSEINAAWGQTALLLHSLANKIELTFERYRLVPYGNHSYVECIADRSKELPLYGSGGIRFFWDTKFDQAMVAFLDCLQQFKEEVERGDTGFCLPYRMDRAGHIEGTGTGNSYSVKTQFNSEEQWTKALKFVLTNLKWGLAWVSAEFVSK